MQIYTTNMNTIRGDIDIYGHYKEYNMVIYIYDGHAYIKTYCHSYKWSLK